MMEQKNPSHVLRLAYFEGSKNMYCIFNNLDRLLCVGIGIFPTDQSFFAFYIMQDPSAHMNLGAMLHLVGKLKEAENHYLTAWSLNPGDPSTRTNLERLHNIMRAKRIPFQPLN